MATCSVEIISMQINNTTVLVKGSELRGGSV